MPDNVAITAGTGTTVSTEEFTTLNGATVPAQHGQRVIAAVRTGDATVADVTSANPFPVVAKTDEMNVDIHGQRLSVSRVVQLTAKFFQQAPDQFLSISASGGATATGPTAGLGVFASGTATTAALLAQTPTSVMYATQFEAWASMAGVFTAPTSAASFQRLGIYNAANGYFFGYSGLTFGVTIRVNSVDTFVPKTSWNVDTLIGDVASKFSAGGPPVAHNPNNMNMYRIRYGWYGAVTARFEVYSPDGDWVLVHQHRTANGQTGANLTNPDLPMAVEVSKTASDATNLIISCGGWGAGITSGASGTTLSGQGAIAALNAAIVVPVTGVGGVSFSVTGTWVGTLSFQYSLDGLAWTADTSLNNAIGAFTSSATANGAFTAPVGSYKFFRITATAWTSGSASVVYNASPASTVVAVRPPTLTKATQSATGFSTQDLKDSGRVVFSATTVIAGVTAVTVEALVTLVSVRNGVAAATAVTQAVTAGKRLRITHVTIGFVSTAAAVLSMRFVLRTNPAGAATATSPIVQIMPLASGAALIQAGNQMTFPVPDGTEFTGADQFGITQIGSAATGTVWITVHGFEY